MMDRPWRRDIQRFITKPPIYIGFIAQAIINPYVFFICSNFRIRKGIDIQTRISLERVMLDKPRVLQRMMSFWRNTVMWAYIFPSCLTFL